MSVVVARWSKPNWTFVRPLFRAWWNGIGGQIPDIDSMRCIRSWSLRAFLAGMDTDTEQDPLFVEQPNGRMISPPPNAGGGK